MPRRVALSILGTKDDVRGRGAKDVAYEEGGTE